jgi:hypothetical protein
VEIEELSWNNKSITVRMRSQKDQNVNLVLPSAIKNIDTKNKDVKIKKSNKEDTRIINLPAMKTVELTIELK